jgi:hypothetical protein
MCYCTECQTSDPENVGCYCEEHIVCSFCRELEEFEDAVADEFEPEAGDEDLQLEDPEAWKHDATGTP